MATKTSDNLPPLPGAGGGQAGGGGGGQLQGVTFLGQPAVGGGGGDQYHVKSGSGQVMGPFDRELIKQMIRLGKLSGNEGVSRDQSLWIPITAVPEFAEVLREQQGAPSGGTMAGLPAIGFGGPPGGAGPGTGNTQLPVPKGFTQYPVPNPVAGPGTLPPISAGPGGLAPPPGALPQAPGGGGFGELPPAMPLPPMSAMDAELPAPVGGGPELPAPVRGAELPAPVSGGPELPAPVGGGWAAELPTNVRSELPQSAGAQLPSPVGPSGLPQSAGGPELPSPLGAGQFADPNRRPSAPRNPAGTFIQRRRKPVRRPQ